MVGAPRSDLTVVGASLTTGTSPANLVEVAPANLVEVARSRDAIAA
ncbi:hypothetical protein ACMHYB_47575 [Sorangium sp. So ce1128]